MDLETRLRRTLEERRQQLPAPRRLGTEKARRGAVRRHRLRAGVAAAVVVVVATVGVALTSGVWDATREIRLGPAPTDTAGEGWQRYLGDSFEISYPPGWKPAAETLTSDPGAPVEIVTFGTGPLVVGGQECAQVPEAAVEAMRPDDVLLTVQRRSSDTGFPSRPERFTQFTLDRLAFGDCFDNRDRIDFAGLDFADDGRGYTAYAYFGAETGSGHRDRVLQMLNTFQAGQPGQDLACTTQPVTPAALPDDVRSWAQDASVAGAATLWAIVPDSRWITYDLQPQTEGSPYGLKQPWFRTAPGQVAIDVDRLDGPGTANVNVPDGYGQDGFQVSGIRFDTPGCWRIVGTDGTSATTIHVSFPGRASGARYEVGAVWTCQDTLDADESQVIAAYTTTGRRIHRWHQERTPPDGPSASPAWAQHPDDTELTVCIVDDVIMKGSPGGANLDRSIVFVTPDGTPQPAISAQQEDIAPSDGPQPAGFSRSDSS